MGNRANIKGTWLVGYRQDLLMLGLFTLLTALITRPVYFNWMRSSWG